MFRSRRQPQFAPEAQVSEATDPCALIAVDHLSQVQISNAIPVCVSVGVRPIDWHGDLNDPIDTQHTLALISRLAAGQRQIPAGLVDFGSRYPEVSLILLCDEPLVRPSVTLLEGRVTLLGDPVAPERLGRKLRNLISRHEALQDVNTLSFLEHSTDPRSQGNVISREFLRTHWWVSVIVCHDDDGPSPALPTLRQGFGQGLTACLPSLGRKIADEVVDRAAEVMRHDETLGDKQERLVQLLGDRVGCVHLGAGADRWTIYWPDPTWPITLASSLRLPHQWDMAASIHASGASLFQLSAAGGDLIIAGTSAHMLCSADGAGEADGDFTRGGPAVLDSIANALRNRQQSCGGVLMEVR